MLCLVAWRKEQARVNYTDKFAAIRTVVHVLVQSCQPNKHCQCVDTPLCHCGCSDGLSHGFTHNSALPLHCGWAFELMLYIRACFWVYSARTFTTMCWLSACCVMCMHYTAAVIAKCCSVYVVLYYCLSVYATHHFVTSSKVWLTPKRCCLMLGNMTNEHVELATPTASQHAEQLHRC